MTNRSKSEHLVRSSASSVMRKLSVASIASSFSRRPGSLTSLHRSSADTDVADGDDESGQASGKSSVDDTIPEQTCHDEGSDGSGYGRLPMIKYKRPVKKAMGQGHKGDASTSPRNEDAAASESRSSREGMSKRLAWAQDKRQQGRLSPVSRSTTNSLQPDRVAPKQSPVPSEKENYQPEKTARTGNQRRKLKRRRTSRGGVNKEVMLSGIRGIFR